MRPLNLMAAELKPLNLCDDIWTVAEALRCDGSEAPGGGLSVVVPALVYIICSGYYQRNSSNLTGIWNSSKETHLGGRPDQTSQSARHVKEQRPE